MARIDTRIGLALLAAVAFSTPARAEEPGNDWLGVVGDFVRAGLGPARTIDDIRKDEERAREAASRDDDAPKQPEPVKPTKVAHPQPVPLTPEAAPEASAPAAAVVVPPPAAVAPQRHAVATPAPVVPEARPPAPKPAAAPLPVPEARPATPKPAAAVVARVPTPPPEPLSSRIAATATVDQALKLGGSADTYIKKPARN